MMIFDGSKQATYSMLCIRKMIRQRLQDANQTKDTIAIDLFHLILAVIRGRDLAVQEKGNLEQISNDEVCDILRVMLRQRQKSFRFYEDSGCLDLAYEEEHESNIILSLLPSLLDHDELRTVCYNIVKETNARGFRDISRCLSTLQQRYHDRVDLSRASHYFQSHLLRQQ